MKNKNSENPCRGDRRTTIQAPTGANAAAEATTEAKVTRLNFMVDTIEREGRFEWWCRSTNDRNNSKAWWREMRSCDDAAPD